MPNQKIAIVGAGPVGLFLSLALSREGHSVTIFEKGFLPLDKVCGQGIMPSGVGLLKKMGLDFSSEEAYSFNGIHYFDGLQDIQAEMKNRGLGVERIVLSQKLHELVQKDEKITLHEGQKVDSLINKDGKVHLNNDFIFDYVFACDGLNSLIRKSLGLESERRGPCRMGARVHYDCSPWSSCVEVYWNDGIEAYVTPVSDKKIEVAFLWFEDVIEKGANLDQRLMSYFPDLFKKIDGAKVCNDFKAYGPFKKTSQSIRNGNIFLVGDAYKFLDGITGEGISLGLKSAALLARDFQNMGSLTKIKIYLLYLNYAIWVKSALLLSRNPRARYWLFKLLKKDRFIFKTILRFNDLHWKQS